LQKKSLFLPVHSFTCGNRTAATIGMTSNTFSHSNGADMTGSSADGDLRQRLANVIADEVAPLLDMDGSGIELVSIENGIVRIRLHGPCGCCPGSVQTAIMGIEQELHRRVPEIDYLEVVP
jgi:lysyl-tRNA synthetase class 2